MKQRPFGAATTPVSVIGQGTWNSELSNRAEAVKALQRGIDLGMTHIDTAEMYGSGKAEAITGDAIAGRRGEVFLVSKVSALERFTQRHDHSLRALAEISQD